MSARLLIMGLCFCSLMAGLNASAQETGQADLPDQGTAGKEEGADRQWLEFPALDSPGIGKKVVLISGDDEYRSEEAMPMLADILSQKTGFHCIVLFPVNPENGFVQPDFQTNIPGMEHLDDADLVIMGLRFRNLPDEQMQHFDNYVRSGRPIIALRTSTHAFNIPEGSNSSFAHYSYDSRSPWNGGFGGFYLGETWVSHHGGHGSQSTRGVVVAENANHPVLAGVENVWGPTDVYGVRKLPEDCVELMQGAVLAGMSVDDQPVDGDLNNPMMPLAWCRELVSPDSDIRQRIVTTTMGASQDFVAPGLRRFVVNAALWCVGLEERIRPDSDVDAPAAFKPTPFGFGKYAKGRKPVDFLLAK